MHFRDGHQILVRTSTMPCKQLDQCYFILSKNHHDNATPIEQCHSQTTFSMTMPVREISKPLVDHPNDNINVWKKTSSATLLTVFKSQNTSFQSREYSTFIQSLKNIFGINTSDSPPLQQKSNTVDGETSRDSPMTKKVVSIFIPNVTGLPDTLKYSTTIHHNFPRPNIGYHPITVRNRKLNLQIENDIKQENVNGVIPNNSCILYGSDNKKDDWDAFSQKTINKMLDKANQCKEDIQKVHSNKKLHEASQIAKKNAIEVAKDVKVVTKVLLEEAIQNIKEAGWRSKKLDLDRSAKGAIDATHEDIQMLKAQFEEEKKKATDTDWNKILSEADKIAKKNITDLSNQLNKYNEDIKNVDWCKKLDEPGDAAKKSAENVVTTKVAKKAAKGQVQQNVFETDWFSNKNDSLEKLKASQDEMHKLNEKMEKEKIEKEKKETEKTKKFAVIDKSFCKIAQGDQIMVSRDMDELKLEQNQAATFEVSANQAKPMSYHVGTDNLLTHFIELQVSKIRNARGGVKCSSNNNSRIGCGVVMARSKPSLLSRFGGKKKID